MALLVHHQGYWHTLLTLSHEARFSDHREKTMQLEDTQVGTKVRVQLDYRTPHRQGTVGTIKKRYEIPEYTTFEVLFADGQRELFWDHQLEEAKESSPKGWWVFW